MLIRYNYPLITLILKKDNVTNSNTITIDN